MIRFIIPARAGSKGVPHKNRLLFNNTADALAEKSGWDNEDVIVTTDDSVIQCLAIYRNYTVNTRP